MIGFWADPEAWTELEDTTGLGWTGAVVASQVASALARRQAEKAVRERREAALQRERTRQAALQQQANQALERSMASVTPAAQQQAVQGGIDTRVRASEQRARPADADVQSGEYAGVSPTAPTVVKEAAARAIIDALEKGREYTRTLAGMKGYGDAALSTGIGLNRTNQQLGQLSSFSRGSQAVLPYELDAVRGADRGWLAAHDELGRVSTMGQLYGMGVLDYHARKQRREPTMSYLYGTGRISD